MTVLGDITFTITNSPSLRTIFPTYKSISFCGKLDKYWRIDGDCATRPVSFHLDDCAWASAQANKRAREQKNVAHREIPVRDAKKTLLFLVAIFHFLEVVESGARRVALRLKEAVKLSDAGGVAHFAQGFGFNLADTFAGDIKLFSDFFKRA